MPHVHMYFGYIRHVNGITQIKEWAHNIGSTVLGNCFVTWWWYTTCTQMATMIQMLLKIWSKCNADCNVSCALKQNTEVSNLFKSPSEDKTSARGYLHAVGLFLVWYSLRYHILTQVVCPANPSPTHSLTHYTLLLYINQIYLYL